VSVLTEAYQKLCELYKIDTIILIDAGVDSLLKGDEQGLGTFAEDLLSTMAAKKHAKCAAQISDVCWTFDGRWHFGI